MMKFLFPDWDEPSDRDFDNYEYLCLFDEFLFDESKKSVVVFCWSVINGMIRYDMIWKIEN